MKWVHRIVISTFAKPEDAVSDVEAAMRSLVPFNLEEAKVKLEVQKSEGFNHRTIKIFTIILLKESHTNDFLQFLLDNLADEQKRLLISQAESRLDENFDFFIRVDNDHWANERKIWFTDTGNCFHIKLSLAVFPKRKATALALVEKLLTQKNI